MDDTLSLNEAAKFLKIHPVTLADKARAGEIPGAKVCRAWVFLKMELKSINRDLLDRIHSARRAEGVANRLNPGVLTSGFEFVSFSPTNWTLALI